jgi:quercetin dioxygenase-like cupin family protein
MREHLIFASVLCIVIRTAVAGSSPGVTQRGLERQALRSQSGLILQVDEGERIVRRPASGTRAANPPTPSIIKVDRKNGGSPDLVMGYETLSPGRTIQPHRHLVADEIIFVHSGTGTATVGDHEAPIGPGATVYIPRNVRITLANTGTERMAIAFFFSKPGFEDYMRDTSVPEGQPAPPMSPADLEAIRQKHAAHTVYEPR